MGEYGFLVYFDIGSVEPGSYMAVYEEVGGNSHVIQNMTYGPLSGLGDGVSASFNSTYCAYQTDSPRTVGTTIDSTALTPVATGLGYVYEDTLFAYGGTYPSNPDAVRLHNESGATVNLGITQAWFNISGDGTFQPISIEIFGNGNYVDILPQMYVFMFLCGEYGNTPGTIINNPPDAPQSLYTLIPTDSTPRFYYTAEGGFSTTMFADFYKKFPNIDEKGHRVPARTPGSKPAPPPSSSSTPASSSSSS